MKIGIIYLTTEAYNKFWKDFYCICEQYFVWMQRKSINCSLIHLKVLVVLLLLMYMFVR